FLATRQVRTPMGGDVGLKTILGWSVLAFAIWWMIEQPTNALHLVHNIGTFLSTAGNRLSQFVASI
ncbi:MAG: hypothetical protein ACRDOE_26620, partial [Streptosporangiaceae bacterium]